MMAANEDIFKLRKKLWNLKKRKAMFVGFCFVSGSLILVLFSFLIVRNVWIELSSCILLGATLAIYFLEFYRRTPVELVDEVIASSIITLASQVESNSVEYEKRGEKHFLSIGGKRITPLSHDFYQEYAALRSAHSFAEFLEEVLVHRNKFAQEVRVEWNGSSCDVELKVPKFAFCSYVHLRDPSACSKVGCPLQSFVAEALLDYVGSRVKVLSCSFIPSSLSIKMKFAIEGEHGRS